MKPKYHPEKIEPKWQKIWKKKATFHVEIDKTKPKYYVLDMFPYPSGSGLHVGHVVGYTGSDVVARYKRQKGFNVLHPMGWDSFGLPAEQYAIRSGTHPQITTEKNIEVYRRQLCAMGFSYDWDREIATSDPSYYKWTQWIFTKLYEKGLAYEAEVLVNYCPALGTVLANEEVIDGRSVDGGYPVERKPLKQWMLKITEYAEQLLSDLDELDWPEHLKRLQENWIGKSEGVILSFAIENSKDCIECYTTRCDTIHGVTFLVLSPEHPLVSKITSEKQKSAVMEYQKASLLKSDLERTELNKDKSGVFTGAYALHPITHKPLPIFIADYVLMHYAKGAVMGVPADDERDKEFAAKYGLHHQPIFDEEGNYLDFATEPNLTGLSLEQAKEKVTCYLENKKCGNRCIQYKLRDWLFSRQRYWGEPFPIYHFENGEKRVLDIDELPLTPPMIEDFKPSGDGRSPLAKCKSWVEIIDPKTGKKAMRETNTMPQWAGSCWYYLRFVDAKNDKEAWSREKEQYWMPVDLYIGGVEHAVLHLLYARFWHKVLYDLGLVSTKEPFSSLRNQGLVTSRSFRFESGGYVASSEVKEENGEFLHKVSGQKLLSQIEKMSKSKLNGISPDEMIAEFGADTLRLYVLFMTPFEKEKIWQMDAMMGCRRFLNRVFDLLVHDLVTEQEDEKASRLINKLVHDVEQDLETLSFNTAIAKMMEFLNAFTKCSIYPKSALKIFMQLLYPFAPHFSEEGWEMLGEKDPLSSTPFPTVDPHLLSEEKTTLVLQIMGKVRGTVECKKGIDESDALKLLKDHPNASRYISKEIRKVIFVPDKLINVIL